VSLSLLSIITSADLYKGQRGDKNNIKKKLNDPYLPFPNQFPTHSTTLGQPELW